MHWTAGIPVCFISSVAGPPPVICIVRLNRSLMYYEDLALCDYHPGPCDARAWRSPLQAVGWLEHPHPFRTGLIPPQVLDRLEAFIAVSWAHYLYYAFRGLHECSHC